MKLFEKFPKIRRELPPEYVETSKINYKENRERKTFFHSLSQKVESWAHIQAVKDKNGKSPGKATLEIGAGTFNHLQYEPENDEYDVVEPQKQLYEDSKYLNRIRKIYSDISEIHIEQSYDQILSFYCLEHICNLPEVIARCGMLLENGGKLKVGIPSEGTFLWNIAWRLTTGLEFRIRHGLDLGVIMENEHINTAREIEDVLIYFFKDIHAKVFGVSKSFSLYQFYSCSSPYKERCIDYIDQINNSSR